MSNPSFGIPLGAKLFKVRLANKDKNKGKRGGFRVITYHVSENGDVLEVYLVTIYDKSEEEDIPKQKLINMARNIFNKRENNHIVKPWTPSPTLTN